MSQTRPLLDTGWGLDSKKPVLCQNFSPRGPGPAVPTPPADPCLGLQLKESHWPAMAGFQFVLLQFGVDGGTASERALIWEKEPESSSPWPQDKMTHTTTQACQGMIHPVGNFFECCQQGAHRATMNMRAPPPALAHCTYLPERRMALKCKPPHAAGVVTGSTIFQDSQDRRASNLIKPCLLEQQRPC